MIMQNVYGWSGKILYIDVTTAITHVESTLEHIAYIGGRGINQWLLFNLMEKDVGPLDPENLLIFGVGCLVGTMAPGACRVSIETKNVYSNGKGSANFGCSIARKMQLAGDL